MKSPKALTKMHRLKVLKTSNLAYTLLLVQRRISLKNMAFLCLLAVLGSQGIMVKSTSAIPYGRLISDTALLGVVFVPKAWLQFPNTALIKRSLLHIMIDVHLHGLVCCFQPESNDFSIISSQPANFLSQLPNGVVLD